MFVSFFDIVGVCKKGCVGGGHGREPVASALRIFGRVVGGAGYGVPGVSLGRASGVFGGLTKARLVRIFVGLGICLLGLVAWLVGLLVNLRV